MFGRFQICNSAWRLSVVPGFFNSFLFLLWPRSLSLSLLIILSLDHTLHYIQNVRYMKNFTGWFVLRYCVQDCDLFL